MKVRFWGTRGSIAKAGPGTLRYGGNTSCVELETRAGTLLVLDCGTGAHGLGQALAEARPSCRGHILISHTHWDHIQGFPFFVPLFTPNSEWDVYAPRGLRESLRETLAGQMQYKYFPVTLDQLAATVRYHDLVEGEFTIADVRVTARYLNHPALTLGYRLDADGVVVVYATDHEPHGQREAWSSAEHLAGEDRRHADFLANADLVIHDAQYTAAEYPAKRGWGHSPAEYVVRLAALAGVRRLALFHHDPLRDDDAVDDLVRRARAHALEVGAALDVIGAAEGQAIEVEASGERRVAAPPAAADARVCPPSLAAHTVLIALDDAGLAERVAEAVRSDGLQSVVAATSHEVADAARRAQPSLILLGRHFGGDDGLELCRALRDGESSRLDVPVVMVSGRDDGADRIAGARARVTDWLIAPFSPVYAQTRIRAWMLRQTCRWQCAPLPPDEPERLRALRQLRILDSAPEERFDRLTRLARHVFDVPIALVTLVDEHRQWFKSRYGLDAPETPRDMSFCAHAILGGAPLIVPDALLDDRFADNPAVTEPPAVRFYAGCPLHTPAGQRVGTLCIADRRPRQLDDEQIRVLADLAGLAERELAQ